MIKPNIMFTAIIVLVGILAAALISCQAPAETKVAEADSQPAVVQNTDGKVEEPVDDDSAAPETSESTEPEDSEPENKEAQPEIEQANPELIESIWGASPHAETYVTDDAGNNSTCARCHAPVDWIPSMDDLPESCYVCKFEVEDPPPYISEGDWKAIPCNVCHEPDKKGNIPAEYSWLEIAVLEEYSPVASSSELCMKCHDPVNITEHASVNVGGIHSQLGCIECHDAHDIVASCGDTGCHEDVLQPESPIAGHDDDHQKVLCVACHDGGGFEVGPDDESGFWTTFLPWNFGDADAGTALSGSVAFSSHFIVLESSCDRCHYSGNPWNLSEDVIVP